MTAGRIALITGGALAAMLAAALLAAAVWVKNADTSGGYIVTDSHRAQSVTHALASRDLDVDSGFDWILDRGPELRPEQVSPGGVHMARDCTSGRDVDCVGF